jgi:queuine/archaeosine tRNA-ribosyltransferase
VRFYQRLVADARRAIGEGGFEEWHREFLARYAASSHST